jgi:ribA/ribD-fused uncharacterized protein
MIIATTDAKTAKALGRMVTHFEADKSNFNCREIVTRANVAKFQQNALVREFLVGTTGKGLVEASPYDRIWGIGLRESDYEPRTCSSGKAQTCWGLPSWTCETNYLWLLWRQLCQAPRPHATS